MLKLSWTTRPLVAERWRSSGLEMIARHRGRWFAVNGTAIVLPRGWVDLGAAASAQGAGGATALAVTGRLHLAEVPLAPQHSDLLHHAAILPLGMMCRQAVIPQGAMGEIGETHR